MARPQLNHPAGDEVMGAKPRMPGEHLTRDYADQCLRAARGRHGCGEIAGLPGDGQTEYPGGQPATDLLLGGETREDGFRGSQCGDTRFTLATSQRRCSGDQVRLGLVPAFAVRHAQELTGQGLGTPRLHDLGDRQAVDDHSGGQLPVARYGGVPHRVGERAVLLT